LDLNAALIKEKNERAVRCSREEGFLNQKADDGENRPGRLATPILLSDGVFPAKKYPGDFKRTAGMGYRPNVR
jgi:hypothetical protein